MLCSRSSSCVLLEYLLELYSMLVHLKAREPRKELYNREDDHATDIIAE